MNGVLVRRSVGAFNPWRASDLVSAMSVPMSFTQVRRTLGEVSAVPAFDLYETADALTAVVSVPGLAVEDVKVEIENGRLRVSGRRGPAYDVAEGVQVRVHRVGLPTSGGFEIDLELPIEVEGDRAEATYTDGLLRVRMPRAERARARTIPVTVAHEASAESA